VAPQGEPTAWGCRLLPSNRTASERKAAVGEAAKGTCRACCREQGVQAERDAGNREHMQSVLQGTGSTGRACCREQGAQAERVAGNREHMQSVLQGTGSTGRAGCSSSSSSSSKEDASS